MNADSKLKQSRTGWRCCPHWLCPPFSGLCRDLVGYRMRFVSDLLDAFSRDNWTTVLLGVLFVYFTVLAPAITFGALMSKFVAESFNMSLFLVACGSFQLLFALFGGQPMIIVGLTGPIFIIESAIGMLSASLETDLHIVRFWVAIYTALAGLLVVALNLIIIVRFIRRSVEEVFNCFEGIYYVFKALSTMFKMIPSASEIELVNNATASINGSSPVNSFSSHHEDRARASATFFLAFFMLAISIALVEVRRGKYLTRQIRSLFGSFNVPLGILLVMVLERMVFPEYNLGKLSMPQQSSNVSWIHPPNFHAAMTASGVLLHACCFTVGLCLSILICTETMISGVTVAKSERKLGKPCLFALDLTICMVIFPVLSGCLGWPFVTGAVVRSCSHVISMTKWDLNTLPGVPHKIIGCAEQRVSGCVVGLLVVLSVLLGALLRHIPMAAMYGMFLYMGIMGLRDLMFVRRCIALLQRRKHWPQTDALRNLPYRHLMALSSVQGFAIALLVVCNCVTEFAKIPYPSFAFPFVLLAYALVREFVLPHWTWINRYLEEMDFRHKIVLSGFSTARNASHQTLHGSRTKDKALTRLRALSESRLVQYATDEEALRKVASHGQVVLPAGVDPKDSGDLDSDESDWERDAENPYPHG